MSIYPFIDCHVKKDQHETKAELKYIDGKLSANFLKVKGKKILNGDDINKAEVFITEKHIQIVTNGWCHSLKKLSA